MFEELHALIDDSIDHRQNSILVTSFDFDTNFILQHFLSYSLKNSFNCVYISLLTSFTHLKHVQAKMGNTLKSPESSPESNLTFIPLFTSISNKFFQDKNQSFSIDDFCTCIQEQIL